MRYIPELGFITLIFLLAGCNGSHLSQAALNDLEIINTQLERSAAAERAEADTRFGSFEATTLKSEPERARLVYERVVKVRSFATALSDYINETKLMLVKEAGGVDHYRPSTRSDITAVTRIMTEGRRADTLKQKIQQTSDSMLVYANRDEHVLFNAEQKTARFDNGTPLILALATLSQLQAGVYAAEVDVEKQILNLDPSGCVIDRVETIVLAPSSTIETGDLYRAEIFLHNYSHNNPDILINGQKIKVADDKGYYEAFADAPGVKRFSGVLRITQANGTIQEYTIPEHTYTVVPKK
jgi:GldM N-terminal domain